MSQPRAESAPADVALPGSPVLPQTIDEDKTIRFREFVASDGFAGLFDLPADEMRKILADDAGPD